MTITSFGCPKRARPEQTRARARKSKPEPPSAGERLFFAIIALIFTINTVYPRAAFAQERLTLNSPAAPFAGDELRLPPNQPKLQQKIKKSIKALATAYSSTPDQTDDTPFITANGKYVYDGLVAANFLPFGAKLRLPEICGDKIFTVDDRMNARYKQRIDVWMKSRQEAKNFGAKIVSVEILE